MADLSDIVRFLEVERERYVLEASQLERRLSFISDQIRTLSDLISGYALEDQVSSQILRQLPDASKIEAVLEEPLEAIVDEKPQTSPSVKPDICDIPKLAIPRKHNSLPLLPEYQQYSLQNAVLILMRTLPDRHIHIDAIVRDIHGNNLTSQQFKTAKITLNKILSMGKQTGLWYRVLDTQGVYTLNYEKGVTSEKPTTKL